MQRLEIAIIATSRVYSFDAEGLRCMCSNYVHRLKVAIIATCRVYEIRI